MSVYELHDPDQEKSVLASGHWLEQTPGLATTRPSVSTYKHTLQVPPEPAVAISNLGQLAVRPQELKARLVLPELAVTAMLLGTT